MRAANGRPYGRTITQYYNYRLYFIFTHFSSPGGKKNTRRGEIPRRAKLYFLNRLRKYRNHAAAPPPPSSSTATMGIQMGKPFSSSTGSGAAVVSGTVSGWVVYTVVSTVGSVVSSVVSTGSPIWNTMCSVRSVSLVVR